MEPIAIIGLGCRFPGAAGPRAFWELLQQGRDAIRETPADRWDSAALVDADPAAPGKLNTRWGGFLDQIDSFDAAFFTISPREAPHIDPQQRLMLEVAWEALEDAGLAPERLAGSQTGVFVGVMNHDYSQITKGDLTLVNEYTGPGNGSCIVANRLSYSLDLRGPSVVIDTACSSSLVAVHLACQALWSGECELALAGGVNVLGSPWGSVYFTKANLMAPDGRCKSFDARANGIARGEGAGLVVLKPLARALADNDQIYATVRGSAVNQNGRGNGLTAPSREAQQAVLRAAYARAGVRPGEVQYVEAHSAGTQLGESIEARALGEVLAEGRPAGSRCAIGSVKTNFGHLESAAGIAGVIKVALALRHGAIPASLHFEQPNPLIPFDTLPLAVQQRLGPWPADEGPALAGVSGFGFGGVNAHVVLAAAPEQAAPAPQDQDGDACVLALSARSAAALADLARACGGALGPGGQAAATPLGDLCAAAALRREHANHRLALVFSTRAEALALLDAAARGETAAGLFSGRRVSSRRAKLVFVFSDRPPAWRGLGRALFEREPALRETLAACDELLRPLAGCSLLDALLSDGPPAEAGVARAALFALQAGLAALWRAWGVSPDALIGHGAGAAAAAYCAGMITLEDGLRLAFGDELASPTPRAPALPITITRGAEPDSAAWRAALGEPVAFGQAVERLLEQGCRHYLEIGPERSLGADVQEQLDRWGGPGLALASLERDQPDRAALLRCLAALYTQGYDVEWGGVYPRPVRPAPLPTYPWQRQRFWLETRATPSAHADQRQHPLLGAPVDLTHRSIGYVWQFALDRQRLAALGDYGDDSSSLPAAACADLALAGAREVFSPQPCALGEWTSHGLLWLSPDQPASLQLTLSEPAAGLARFEVVGAAERGAWMPLASGALRIGDAGQAEPPLTLEALSGIPPEQRRTAVETYLIGLLAGALGAPGDSLEPDQVLNTLGLDSLMILQIRKRLEAQLGVTVTLTDFFNDLTIGELAGQVLAAAAEPAAPAVTSEAGWQPSGARIGAQEASDLLANLDQIGDDDLDALLETLLEEAGESHE